LQAAGYGHAAITKFMLFFFTGKLLPFRPCHARQCAPLPEEAKQSSKTAGRTAVAARRCRHENYPAREVTVPQRHPQSKQ
jgi:hypothetical protein